MLKSLVYICLLSGTRTLIFQMKLMNRILNCTLTRGSYISFSYRVNFPKHHFSPNIRIYTISSFFSERFSRLTLRTLGARLIFLTKRHCCTRYSGFRRLNAARRPTLRRLLQRHACAYYALWIFGPRFFWRPMHSRCLPRVVVYLRARGCPGNRSDRFPPPPLIFKCNE